MDKVEVEYLEPYLGPSVPVGDDEKDLPGPKELSNTERAEAVAKTHPSVVYEDLKAHIKKGLIDQSVKDRIQAHSENLDEIIVPRKDKFPKIPTAIPVATVGADRKNDGKLRWALFDFKSAEETVKVLEFGANKYAPSNWKKGLNRDEILESTFRHLQALFDGQEIDPESGLPHTGHINCNMMFYRYFRDNSTFKETRNNPFKNEDK